MKIFYILFSISIQSTMLYCCPTCEGKVKPESPLFFSNDFYKPGQANSISRTTKEQMGTDEFKKLIERNRSKK